MRKTLITARGNKMEIIKKFKSGKTKIAHDGITIFVKPTGEGEIIRSNTRKLTEKEAAAALLLATGKTAKWLKDWDDNSNNWESIY